MGENDTAALDPIFFFHHCFIDYVFWIWQRRHGATESFTIDGEDPGAKYNADYPPPAGADPNAPMSLTTPLEPFFKEYGVPFTTADVINIQSQLGYTYGPGSLDGYVRTDAPQPMAPATEPEQKTVHVAGIDRSKIRGSFLIAAWADLEGQKQLIGIEPVLSRWQVLGCANCQTKLRVSADLPLPSRADPGSVAVEVHTRDGLLGNGPSPESSGLMPMALATPAAAQQLTVEIR
jgi:tyrosinase